MLPGARHNPAEEGILVALGKGADLVREPAEEVEGTLCLGAVENRSGNNADIPVGDKPLYELAYFGAD